MVKENKDTHRKTRPPDEQQTNRRTRYGVPPSPRGGGSALALLHEAIGK